jgi:hypothetical protein
MLLEILVGGIMICPQNFAGWRGESCYKYDEQRQQYRPYSPSKGYLPGEGYRIEGGKLRACNYANWCRTLDTKEPKDRQ